MIISYWAEQCGHLKIVMVRPMRLFGGCAKQKRRLAAAFCIG
jgi:hypothetical protein